MNKTRWVCLFSLGVLGTTSWFSVEQHQSLQQMAEQELAFLEKPIKRQSLIIPAVSLERLFGVEKFSSFEDVSKRDLFSKFQLKGPELPEAPIVEAPPLMEVKQMEEPEEPELPVIEEPVIEYIYRGTMVVEGEEAYIIQQENPAKWHYLKPDAKKGELTIVEAGRYGITIRDKQGKEYELTIKKEF